MQPEDTLAGILAEHERAAAATDARIRELPTRDTVRELPKAPWPMDAEWSARRAILHILAETTQHAGHADIIGEALDGAKSLGWPRYRLSGHARLSPWLFRRAANRGRVAGPTPAPASPARPRRRGRAHRCRRSSPARCCSR